MHDASLRKLVAQTRVLCAANLLAAGHNSHDACSVETYLGIAPRRLLD